ncbi:Pr6Pr family membrane protein [Microbacterium gorillae]|uniref:Pr6Pr family membrane protein n=1 Tax=Microbacterium gorillae TaxID=1231063 RepID=UPI000A8796C0|nr:Pr6Pr family membrane protein [Microbacterium gorillae]
MTAPRPAYGPRLAWGLVRLATAGVIVAAVISQLGTTVSIAEDRGWHLPTVVGNFFSFFTILANIAAAVVLAIAGIWVLARGAVKRYEPHALSVMIVATGTYMVITGIVYNLLLRGIPLDQGATVPWSNEVAHVIAPLILLVELILRVARRPVPWWTIWIVVAFPILWVVYTLARGEHITNPRTGQAWWYPYPFLNPYLTANGYLGVAFWILVIAALIIAVASIAVWWTRRRRVVTDVSTTDEPTTDDDAVEVPAPADAPPPAPADMIAATEPPAATVPDADPPPSPASVLPEHRGDV